MSKISEEAAKAFHDGEEFKKDNTEVKKSETTPPESICMFLYGNMIAVKVNERVMVSFCGWPTRTTKRRLNALADVCNCKNRFYTENGSLYFGESEIMNNEWIVISE